MRWNEFEKAVIERQSVQRAKEHEKRAADEVQRQKHAGEQAHQFKAALVRENGILKTFHVREILESIRDEVWQEGQVEETDNGSGCNPKRGLKLVSDPYQVVALSYEEGKLVAILEEGWTSLEALVTLDIREQQSERIHMFDSPVFNVVGGSRLSVKPAVRELGLEYGLRAAAILNRHTVASYTPSVFYLCEGDAQNRFNEMLLWNVNNRRLYGSMPAGIRTWADAIVSEMPPQLKDNGRLTPQQLRSWAHDIKGSNAIYRAVDSIFPRRI